MKSGIGKALGRNRNCPPPNPASSVQGNLFLSQTFCNLYAEYLDMVLMWGGGGEQISEEESLVTPEQRALLRKKRTNSFLMTQKEIESGI